MLVNMKELLASAEAGNYAVGSFSVANMEMVLGALQAAEPVSMRSVVDCTLRVPYPLFETAKRMIEQADTRLEEPVFDDAVTLCWRMPAGEEGPLCEALCELTRGTARPVVGQARYAAY